MELRNSLILDERNSKANVKMGDDARSLMSQVFLFMLSIVVIAVFFFHLYRDARLSILQVAHASVFGTMFEAEVYSSKPCV